MAIKQAIEQAPASYPQGYGQVIHRNC